jgi:glutamate-ammonia-ligase adenylyltransferase
VSSRTPRTASAHDGKARRQRRIPLEAVLEHALVLDRQRALVNLAAIASRVSSGVMAALPWLLAESPDPDTALNGLERFSAAASPQMLRLFDRQPRLIHYALVVFGYSPYLSDTLIQNPDVLASFAKPAEVEHSYSADDYRLAYAHFQKSENEHDASLQMARFRRRQYIRIMLRDILGIATLADTTADLSALADALAGEALHQAHRELSSRYGAKSSSIAVISLGKLGGNELNYSSDIDLLFLYAGEPGEQLGELSMREFNIRLAQRTTELLARMTTDGPVYRVDLRLRPRGAEGEPAIGLEHALRYYAEEAHDWELQAMIKARHTAGDEALTHEFLARIETFVYRSAVNFAAIETALIARRRMSRRKAGGLWARSAAPGVDVKVGRGGIRDIEFLAQCLQRVYAGQEPWLRSRGTLFALQKLHDKGHLSGRDYHELSSAYVFLRTVEHRLQLRHGQQTHRIPERQEDCVILGRSVGAAMGQEPPERVSEVVVQRMAAVAEIYARIIHQQEVREAATEPMPQIDFSPSSETGAITSFQQMLRRLADDSPEIYSIVTTAGLSPHGRRNLFRVFASAMTSPDRYAAVLAHPAGVQRALQLVETSDFLADTLARHPDEIESLEHISDDAAPHYVIGAQIPHDQRLALLRRQYRHRVFLSAARDVLEHRDVFWALEKSSLAANAAIAAAFSAVGAPAGLAVLALGRLGTLEFDYGSDADIIFVRDRRLPLDEATAAATEVVQALAAYTSEGALFPVDSRLRPRGGEGELVVTPEGLSEYFANEAQSWEALSYTKLRSLAGDEELSRRAVKAVREQLPHFSNAPGFISGLREMRSRLESKDGEHEDLSFKTGPGATYDIDFAVSVLLMRRDLSGWRGNLRDTVAHLRAEGMLAPEQSDVLERAAIVLRTLDHVTRIVTGRARKWLPAAERPAQIVMQLAANMLATSPPELKAELPSVFRQVRSVFDELLPIAR